MNKKGIRLLVIGLLCLPLFLGCGVTDKKGQEVTKTVEAPINKKLSMRGTWQVTEIVEPSKEMRLKSAFSEGESLVISPEILAIGQLYTLSPSYSAKHVDLASYLASRYPVNTTVKNFSEKEIDVLMVRDNDAVNLDIMRLDETHICFSYESRMYYLERRTQDVDQAVLAHYKKLAEKSPKNIFEQKDQFDLMTIVGIKQKHFDENEQPYYTYSTYMIQDNQEYTHPRIFMMDQLFVANKEGRASLLSYEIQRYTEEHGVEEAEFTYKPFSAMSGERQDRLSDAVGRSITYINSGFVAFDKLIKISPEIKDFYKYELHNLNSLSSDMPFQVSDLSKTAEEASFREKILEQLAYYDPTGEIDPAKVKVEYDNLGIVRTSNDWRYVTSQLWTTSTTSYPSRIFVDLVTKVPVIDSGTLGIPWTRVTNKQPLAKTAFTSTNTERLLIQTEDELQYYKLFGDTINQSPEFSIQLPKHSEVIMIDFFYDTSAAHLGSIFLSGTLKQPQVLFSDRLSRGSDQER